MDALCRDQASGDPVVGAVLLLEGLHAANGGAARVDSLFSAGYRIFGIAHMFDNDAGGSAHGWKKTGLTPLGRRMIARIDMLGGIIDLAHASRATIEDVLSVTSRPLLVSHTGLTSSCPSRRNIPDDVVARIASDGGMIGIGFWRQAVCGDDSAAIARAIHRAIDVAGDEHVALGSDFDGGVAMPFDVAHMAVLTSALMDRRLAPEQIRRVMGENQKEFLRANLPAR
jgi:microsomal dipeptidase-like Zn-dependent dipeptidase